MYIVLSKFSNASDLSLMSLSIKTVFIPPMKKMCLACPAQGNTAPGLSGFLLLVHKGTGISGLLCHTAHVGVTTLNGSLMSRKAL